MELHRYGHYQQGSNFDAGRAVINWNALLTRPYILPFINFRAKVSILIEKENYIIKTAENEAELEQTLRLRHDVFLCELLGRRKLFGVDVDKYDPHCDHLMIIDKRNGACVGSYRLNSDLYSSMFYSEKEFSLGRLMTTKGTKLEIGRACIKSEYRKKNMMGLIWEGIYLYVAKMEARYIFGCSSIMTTDPKEVAIIYRYLSQHENYRNDLGIRPTKKYRYRHLHKTAAEVDSMGTEAICREGDRLLPRLIKDYFKCGAAVCGEPALDKSFKCTDVFTVLDMNRLNNAYLGARTQS